MARPIPFPPDASHTPQATDNPEQLYSAPHPFQLALRWQQELTGNSQLTKACIAKREGLSRARVTQVMNLLQLPETIQEQLQNPPPPLNLYAFNERRLRKLLGQNDPVLQLHDWQRLLDELRHCAEN